MVSNKVDRVCRVSIPTALVERGRSWEIVVAGSVDKVVVAGLGVAMTNVLELMDPLSTVAPSKPRTYVPV